MDKKQITNIEVKKNNRNHIFRYICKHETVSNPEIAYATKMSLPTVTQITKELLAQGLLKETGAFESTGGRRAKALAVDADVRQAVGLDITRNHLSFVLTNLTGEILRYKRMYLPYITADDYYHEVNARLEQFLDEIGADRGRLLGIGISFPGIVDLEKEIIVDSHILGVKDLPFASVSRFFSYPCRFLNDANAGAYAEGIRSEGAGRFFYLSLSNTIGGAFFNHGGLEQGTHFRCGEVGHMTIIPGGEPCYCKKRGCLDAYCSARRLSETADGKLEEFFNRLRQGNEEYGTQWEKYTAYLAVALNNIHMVLDCDIILGGYVGSYLEPYLSDIRGKVAQRDTFTDDSLFVKACYYRIGAAALGAALNVTESFIEQV